MTEITRLAAMDRKPKMFLIHGTTRAELASALTEYRERIAEDPQSELGVLLAGVSSDIRAALREKRRVHRAIDGRTK